MFLYWKYILYLHVSAIMQCLNSITELNESDKNIIYTSNIVACTFSKCRCCHAANYWHWSYFKICSEIYFDSNLFPAEQMSDNIMSHRVVWSDRVTDSVMAQRFDHSDKGGGNSSNAPGGVELRGGGEAPCKNCNSAALIFSQLILIGSRMPSWQVSHSQRLPHASVMNCQLLK